jgi:LysM repeat protein
MKEVNQYLTGSALTGKNLKAVKGVVIHWFADPMALATNVIKYWQRLGSGVSAHDVICLDGTLYHAVPYNAVAYQVGCPRGYTKAAVSRLSAYPNDCVVGIECAHLDNTGKMTPETYATLVQHSANLLRKFNLTVNDLWLHSEIVGKDYKDCHRWFTTTKPADWIKFKAEVNASLHPAPKPAPAPTPAVKTYVVQPGDTLWGISAKTGVSVDNLKKFNGLTSDVLSIGKVLKLEASTAPAAPVSKPVVTPPKPAPAPAPKPAPVAVPPYPGTLIKNGSKGADVARIQRALGIKADGIFGSGTEAAVKAYQHRKGLAADGIVGKTTWNTLF